ncbi:tetratricopeptide repeat protein [Shewanella maritima]|uniref:Tetratricopeptide repeat protein n=1 Tax=Shewanella maritima TaxID=2520507 RepID=A0A411PCW2_9GAMM|nr:tetratricopeptide repeat protein [Shewanella maritima]QBF81354.1 tetratricopeptide repeat protein [Shewanella maritima]
MMSLKPCISPAVFMHQCYERCSFAPFAYKHQARFKQGKIISFVAALLVSTLTGCASNTSPTHGQQSSEQQSSNTSEELKSIGSEMAAMHQVNPNVGDSVTTNSANAQSGAATATNGANQYLLSASNQLESVSSADKAKYQQALKLIKQQEWQQATQQLEDLASKYPNLSGVWVNLAIIKLNTGNIDQAKANIDHALTLAPNNPFAMQLRGQVARQQGEFELAQQSYLSALSVWPAYPQAQLNLAILLELYRGQYLEAHQYYSAYLNYNPTDDLAKRYLAGLEIKMRRSGVEIPAKTDNEPNINNGTNVSQQSEASTESQPLEQMP